MAIKDYVLYNGKRIDGYRVHEDGRIFSIGKNIFIRDRRHDGGYRVITIYNNGKQTDCYVHKLVAENFIPNPDNKPQVNHKDGDKTNNKVSNLEWVTGKENRKHSLENGLYKGQNILTRSNVLEIRVNPHNLSMTEFANKFNVSKRAIQMVVTGRNYYQLEYFPTNIRRIYRNHQEYYYNNFAKFRRKDITKTQATW
jgi:predicted DNA-binding protein YlxM (UPF0122 family)